MSRDDMFMEKEREAWVTQELETALRSAAKGGVISCSQAMVFAKNNKVAMNKMKYLMDLFKIKVESCQLGCF